MEMEKEVREKLVEIGSLVANEVWDYSFTPAMLDSTTRNYIRSVVGGDIKDCHYMAVEEGFYTVRDERRVGVTIVSVDAADAADVLEQHTSFKESDCARIIENVPYYIGDYPCSSAKLLHLRLACHGVHTSIGFTVRNLTPHEIHLRGPDGDTTIPVDPAGPARVEQIPGEEFCLQCGIPAISHEPDELGQSGPCGDMVVTPGPGGAELHRAPVWGEVEGLPEAENNTILIVSLLVAQRAIGRADVFAPGTGPKDECIRDEGGKVIAVTRLIQAPLSTSGGDGRCPKGNVNCGC